MVQRRTGAPGGWVAMRRNLLTQAAAENARRGFGGEIQWISMFDKNPPDVDLLIIDEAQHEVATHHSQTEGGNRIQAFLGGLVSEEYDLEGTAEPGEDFDAFFLPEKDVVVRQSLN